MELNRRRKIWRGKPLPYEQYIRLLSIANNRLLAKIIHSRVPRSYFFWLVGAIQNAYLVDNAVVTRVGNVDNPDMIPEIADLMLRLKGVAWAFCQGEYNHSIYLSIRSTNLRKNAGVLMKHLMKGKGTGGGHGLIAGGKVSVRGLEAWRIQELEDEIEKHFLKIIRKGDKPRSSLIEEEEFRKSKTTLVAVK